MNLYRSYKKWLSIGLAAGLSASFSFAYAEGQVAVLNNDNILEQGEEIGAMLVVNGDGRYDVYAAVSGGILAENIFVFGKDGALVPWIPGSDIMPPKLLDNVEISSLSVNERMIQLLPKLPHSDDLKGTYVFFGVLCTPGTIDLKVVDVQQIEIK